MFSKGECPPTPHQIQYELMMAAEERVVILFQDNSRWELRKIVRDLEQAKKGNF